MAKGTNKIVNPNDMTLEKMQEIAETKAAELSASKGLKVTELIFLHEGEYIVGYLEEPNRKTVRFAYDKYEKFGKMEAGDTLLECCLIKEFSDVRILDPSPKYNAIYNWATIEAFKLIEFSISLTKKNMSYLK